MSAPHDDRFDGMAAAYALGALDGDELRAFDEHLGACGACRREVDEFRAVAGLLAYGVPDMAPPASLRDTILEGARSEGSVPGAAPAETNETPSSRAGSRGRSGWGWLPATALLAAASLVLAVVSTIGYFGERDARLQSEAALADVVDQLAERNALLATFLSESVSAAHLTSAGTDPTIRLFWNRDENRLLVAAFNLPPAAAGRTYQLWGIPDGQAPVSLGVFNTDTGGQATVILDVPADVDVQTSDISAITDEPAGGSPQPTTTPFLVGAWEHAQ